MFESSKTEGKQGHCTAQPVLDWLIFLKVISPAGLGPSASRFGRVRLILSMRLHLVSSRARRSLP